MINAFPPNTRFNLAPGKYDLATTGDTTLISLNGDSFVGEGSFSPTTVPSEPPGAVIMDGITLSDLASTDIDGNTLWYQTLSSSEVLTSHGNGACELQGVVNGLQCTSQTAAYPFWTRNTFEPLDALVIDSNGNTEKATTAGTTSNGTTGPSWYNGTGCGPDNSARVGCTTTGDGTVVWTVTVVASSTPTAFAGACAYPQDVFHARSDAPDTRSSVVKVRTLVWPPGAGEWFLDYEDRGGKGIDTAWDPMIQPLRLRAVLPPVPALLILPAVSNCVCGTASNVTIQTLVSRNFQLTIRERRLSHRLPRAQYPKVGLSTEIGLVTTMGLVRPISMASRT